MSNQPETGTGNTAVNELFSQFQEKLTQVAPKAVGIQLGLMLAFSAASVLGFSILRPKNKPVYAPRLEDPHTKSKFSDARHVPGRGFFDWVTPLWHVKEDHLMDYVGMDAVCYLRYLRMMRNMFSAIALLVCVVLIPVNLVYNLRNIQKNQRNPLATITITGVRGNLLYVHVAMSYIITIVSCFFIYINYRMIVRLRWRWFATKEFQDALHNRSLLITNVPKQYKSDEGLQTLMGSLQIPYETTAVHIGRRVGRLPEFIEQYNETVRELEQVLTTYLKNPDHLPSKRPTIRVGAWLHCLGGRKVDAISYYERLILTMQSEIENARKSVNERKPENYGFASFGKVTSAHMVARQLEGKRTKGAKFEVAPHPKDIIWENLARKEGGRHWGKVWGGAVLFVVCVVYCVPLVAVAFLANLAAVTPYVGFLDQWSNKSDWSFSAVQGVLPPLLSVLLQLLLPLIMRFIGEKQGAKTHTELDREVFGRLFTFLIITQLIIFSLLGVAFNTITEVVIRIGQHTSFGQIIRNFDKLPRQIQNTYLQQSNYWLTWFPLRGFSAVFELAQIVNLLWVGLRTKLFGRTPRDIQEWTKPFEFDYPVYYANTLLMAAIAFVYAPLTPLVVVLAAVAFWSASFVAKYLLLYVNVTKVETGGRLWRPAVNRTLLCIVGMQLLMILTIGLQRGWYQSIAAAPPIIIVIVFKIYLRNKFDNRFRWFIPKEKDAARIPDHRADARKNRLERRFGHPALHADLFTPIVHKKSAHLLTQVFDSEKLQRTANAQWNGQKLQAEMLSSGLRIAAADESQLDYDYSQDNDDRWETESMASTAFTGTPGLGGPGAQNDYFNQQKQRYMQYGPAAGLATTPPVPGGGRTTPDPNGRPEFYELNRIRTHESAGSQEMLLRAGYPVTSAPYQHPGHSHSASLQSLGQHPGHNHSASVQSLGQYPMGSVPSQYPPAYAGAPMPTAAPGQYPPVPLPQPHGRNGSTSSAASWQNAVQGFGQPPNQRTPPAGPPNHGHRPHPSNGSFGRY